MAMFEQDAARYEERIADLEERVLDLEAELELVQDEHPQRVEDDMLRCIEEDVASQIQSGELKTRDDVEYAIECAVHDAFSGEYWECMALLMYADCAWQLGVDGASFEDVAENAAKEYAEKQVWVRLRNADLLDENDKPISDEEYNKDEEEDEE